MGREARRVPLDFDWPLKKVWEGYLTPENLQEDPCPDCDLGWSPFAEKLYDEWYGRGDSTFKPEDTGSVRLTPDTPEVRAFAERNVNNAPDFCGRGEAAVFREGWRLVQMWNTQWSHHLDQDDVDALVEAGRLSDFTHTWVPGEGRVKIEPKPEITAAMVNAWSIPGMGHDSINAHICIRAKCERAGEADICATCGGHASVEAYPGQRADAEAWHEEDHDPPTGDGYQMWETTSEGSPITPVFKTPEALAQYCVDNQVSVFANETMSYEEWYRVITGEDLATYSPAPGIIFL